MKKYSKGKDTKFEHAKKMAVNGDERIVSRETDRGPANLQNRSIRRITAFITAVSLRMERIYCLGPYSVTDR